ncbi:MAG: carbohydrate deacetylase [Candidatus Aminicenantales bacterium]
MSRLIVSADDFGLTEGINNGIIKSFKEGIVTSASLMANMPSFEHAVDLARRNPDLAAGIHLNLLKGRPLQTISKVPSLVNTEGIFHTLPEFIKRLLLRKIVIDELESELRSQIERILATGLKAAHLDSHRHFHIYPPILRVIIKLAKEYEINKIRCPLGISIFIPSAKELILTSLSWRSRSILKKNNIKHNQRFFDLVKIENSQNPSIAFARFCEQLGQGVTELDCHPGFVTGELDGVEATIHNRGKQIEILTDPSILKLLQKYEVKLISYDDI